MVSLNAQNLEKKIEFYDGVLQTEILTIFSMQVTIKQRGIHWPRSVRFGRPLMKYTNMKS